MTGDNSSNELLNVWQSQKLGGLAISVEDLRRASDKLARKVLWRNAREYLATIVVVLGYGYFFYKFHTLLLRLGSFLTVAGVLWVAYQLHVRGSAARMATEMDGRNCLDFHRSELVRQRDLLASVWKWYLLPFVPGFSIFMIGQVQLALSQPGAASRHISIVLGFASVGGLCAGVFWIVWKMNQWKAKELQKEIEGLDALNSPQR
jgi:hypothetical protein